MFHYSANELLEVSFLNKLSKGNEEKGKNKRIGS